jgi:hypothetical protein
VIGPTGAVRVMVATKPVDFRMGAEGRATLVRETMTALLGLEEVEQVEASDEAKQDESAPDSRAARGGKRRINRGALPAHLPRIKIVVDTDDKICPCCKASLNCPLF